jgi:hypothetical protein
MHVALVSALFSCSGGTGIAINTLYSVTLAAVTALATCEALRLWCVTRGAGLGPAICGFLLLFHPAWTISALHRDCGAQKFFLSVVVTVIAGVCVFIQRLTAPPRRLELPASQPSDSHETRFFTGEVHRADGILAGPLPTEGQAVSGRQEWMIHPPHSRILPRLLAAVPVALFGYVQYVWFLGARSTSYAEPNWVLGPLYFLANSPGADDWIGYVLLAVAVPCLLSVVCWPTRWTALIASFTGWAWIIPATVKVIWEP